jgi:hypothetical protein
LDSLLELVPYLPVPAFLLSLISIVIAYLSFKRTKVFQEYEYAPRLQLNDELSHFGSRSLQDIPTITYSAEIENRGSKPVEVESIYLDYGARYEPDKRMKYSVEGQMYLSPSQKHNINVTVDWSQVQEMKERFNINQAMFFLRVSFYRPNGNLEESIRSLGGFDGTTTVGVAQPSTRLT